MGKNTLHRLGEGADVGVEVEEVGGKDDGEAPAFGVGAIVGVVEATSTPRQPQVILGKVLRLEAATREVLLAHLKPAATEDGQGCGARFRLVVGRSTWKESYDALVYPIDVEYMRDSHSYILRTPPLDIHQAVMGGAADVQ